MRTLIMTLMTVDTIGDRDLGREMRCPVFIRYLRGVPKVESEEEVHLNHSHECSNKFCENGTCLHRSLQSDPPNNAELACIDSEDKEDAVDGVFEQRVCGRGSTGQGPRTPLRPENVYGRSIRAPEPGAARAGMPHSCDAREPEEPGVERVFGAEGSRGQQLDEDGVT
nr:unnamed protein product [Callosobruchus chinensis]